MKVAFVAVAPFISGSERSLQLMMLNLLDLDTELILICPNGSPLHDWASTNGIKSYRCPLGVLSLKQSYTWIYSQLKLITILSREKVTIVHSNQIWSLPVVQWPCKMLGIKRVCHFRDPIDDSSSWWLSGGVDYCIAISQHIKRSLLKNVNFIDKSKITAVINPIQLPKLSETELDEFKTRARNTSGLHQSDFVFGFIGQVSPVKGVLEIIEAFSQVAEKHKQAKLIIAGKDTTAGERYIEKCQALVVKKKLRERVSFLGYLRDVDTFYNAIDIVVAFSKAEPLGRVPLEAAAYLKPSIASNVDGLPETIIHNKTGWLVELEVTQLQRVMQSCISMDLKELGVNARKNVEKMSDPIRFAQRIYEIYSTLG